MGIITELISIISKSDMHKRGGKGIEKNINAVYLNVL